VLNSHQDEGAGQKQGGQNSNDLLEGGFAVSQPTTLTINDISPYFDLDVEFFQNQWMSLPQW
jgi:hypothetical protein